MPSTANLAGMATDANVTTPAAVAESQFKPTSNITRVGSLDAIRAYLTKRAASASPDELNRIEIIEDAAITGTTGENIVTVVTAPVPLPHLPIAMLSPMGGMNPTTAAGLQGALQAGPPPPVTSAMLPYLAAMNAAAMMSMVNTPTNMAPTSVPTSAVGGGSDGGNKSGYSSGAGVDLVAKGTRRGGSGHRSGTTGDLSNDTVEERVLERKERRMLSNRESARRSRKRKQEHLSELEQQMAAVLAEKAEITARYAMVVAENKALRAELAGVNDGSLPTAFKRTKHELNNATAAAVSMSDDD